MLFTLETGSYVSQVGLEPAAEGDFELPILLPSLTECTFVPSHLVYAVLELNPGSVHAGQDLLPDDILSPQTRLVLICFLF